MQQRAQGEAEAIGGGVPGLESTVGPERSAYAGTVTSVLKSFQIYQRARKKRSRATGSILRLRF